MGLHLLVPVGLAEHLPVPRHRLEDCHRDIFLFMVPQRDLPLDLIEPPADLLPVLLDSLADHVEGLPHLDLHALVLGGVVDPVLADELLAS